MNEIICNEVFDNDVGITCDYIKKVVFEYINLTRERLADSSLILSNQLFSALSRCVIQKLIGHFKPLSIEDISMT